MLTRIFKRVYTVIRLDSSPIIFTRGTNVPSGMKSPRGFKESNGDRKSMDDILEEMLISNLS